MNSVDEETLSRVLASVGRHLETDGSIVLERDAHATRPRRHTRLLLVAAAAIIVILVGLAIAPVRRAVADWLGIGSTSLVRVPTTGTPTSSLAPITSGLSPIDAADAVVRLGRPLPDTTASVLGPPQLLAAMPEGGVLMVWADGASTLWVHESQVPVEILVKKLIGADQSARFVPGIGDGALAITGAHVLVTPHRTVAARTVLLWTEGSTELRLESDLPFDTMISIAEHLS
ncbi:MAG: hypothetical protein ABIR68_14825 [Ilumatobacteraceae bacterium]